MSSRRDNTLCRKKGRSTTIALTRRRSILVAFGLLAATALVPASRHAALAASQPGWTTLYGDPTGNIRDGSGGVFVGGKIYVFGYFDGNNNPQGVTRIFDTGTHVWSTGAPRPNVGNYAGAGAVSLGGGQVLVFGGYNGSTTLANADIYNTSTGAWTSVGNLPDAISGNGGTNAAGSGYDGAIPLSAVEASDGKIYAFGGTNAAGDGQKALFVYDQNSQSWSVDSTTIPNALDPDGFGLSGAALVRSADGSTLSLVGGYDGHNLASGASSTATSNTLSASYNVSTHTWTAGTTAVPSTVQQYSAQGYGTVATLLSNGQVYVVVGSSYAAAGTVAYFYDPTTDTWSAPTFAQAAESNLGTAFMSSGNTTYAVTDDAVEAIDASNPVAGSPYAAVSSAAINNTAASAALWASPNAPVTIHTDAATGPVIDSTTTNGSGFISVNFPIRTTASSLPTYYAVDASSGLSTSFTVPLITTGWTALPTPLSKLSTNPVVTQGTDGKFYVFNGNGTASATQVFDPSADSWSLKTGMPNYHEQGTATPLPDGRILYAGGGGSSDAQIYTPSTDSWVSTTPMPVGINLGAATAGPGGRVYIAGGDGNNTGLLVYDPVTLQWAQGTAIPRAIVSGSATFDGSHTIYVLAAGKDGTNAFLSYNANTGRWSTLPVPSQTIGSGGGVIIGMNPDKTSIQATVPGSTAFLSYSLTSQAGWSSLPDAPYNIGPGEGAESADGNIFVFGQGTSGNQMAIAYFAAPAGASGSSTGSGGAAGSSGSGGSGAATPELGGGELAAIALLPLALVALRKRRTRTA